MHREKRRVGVSTLQTGADAALHHPEALAVIGQPNALTLRPISRYTIVAESTAHSTVSDAGHYCCRDPQRLWFPHHSFNLAFAYGYRKPQIANRTA